uniref:Putative secreted protein n=1 Tax=Ixodes ricinus TaxID=34613 RepID=A0A6B0UGA0_IXORI
MSFLHKLFSTLLTLKWRVSTVKSLVTPQLEPPPEPGPTRFAPVWFVSNVDFFMTRQVTAFRKCLLASLAPKRPFARMNPHVSLQSTFV